MYRLSATLLGHSGDVSLKSALLSLLLFSPFSLLSLLAPEALQRATRMKEMERETSERERERER
jgi:hypothetical protein